MLIRPQQQAHFKLETDVGLTSAIAKSRLRLLSRVSFLGCLEEKAKRRPLVPCAHNDRTLTVLTTHNELQSSRRTHGKPSRAIKDHSKYIVLGHVLSDEEERLF